jgi:hypothetical protein
VLAKTNYYSARDYSIVILAQMRKNPSCTILDVLIDWQASKSIKRQWEFQEIIAVLHCSYPLLLTQWYKYIPDETLMGKVEALKQLLHQ